MAEEKSQKEVKETKSESISSQSPNPKDKLKVPESFGKFEYDTSGFSCAFVLIAIGVLLLLNTTGIISWDVWTNLWRLWPLIFVVWGVEMIIGKNKLFSCIFGCLTTFLFLLLVGLIVISSDNSFKNWINDNIGIDLSEVALIKEAEYKEEQYVVEDDDYSGIEKRKVELELGAGKYELTDKNSLDYLEADLRYAENFESPEWKVEEKKEKLEIEFKTKENWSAIFANYENEYSFNFGRSDLETDLKVDLGSGQGNIDFDRLDINILDVNLGAGKLDIDLGNGAVPNNLELDVGAGEATIILPDDIELEVEYDIGAGELDIDDNSYSGDGDFKQDLENSYDNLKIKVDIGAGKLTIRRK